MYENACCARWHTAAAFIPSGNNILVTFTSHNITQNNRYILHLHIMTATYLYSNSIIAISTTQQGNIYQQRQCAQQQIHTQHLHTIMVTYSSSGRNKDQKLVGCFKRSELCRLFITLPLKIYSKFGQPEYIFGQPYVEIGKKNAKWTATISNTVAAEAAV